MIKISEFNKMTEKEIVEKNDKIYCGVACNDCGQELKYKDYNNVLMSCPPKREVYCPNCGKFEYMYC